MAHRNARLTVHGRLLLVDRVCRQRWPVAHAAKAMGISRQCAHRWVKRYRSFGVAGSADRSSRPHRCPTRTPVETEQRVLQLQEAERRGQDWLGPELGLAPRTVARILRRHHALRLVECDPITGKVIRASTATAVRYKRDRPGELVHMDVKKIGRIPDGGGWKAHGRHLSRRTAAQKRARIGYDFIHSLVDDHSRLAYSEILPDEKGPTCAAFLLRAAAYFHRHGIKRIERVMTDNAWAYRWSLREAVATLDARQVFIKPHCPWQNGKVERLNRTLQTEWAYRQVFHTNAEARRRPCPLAGALQHSTPTHRPRPPTHQPTDTNVMTGYI